MAEDEMARDGLGEKTKMKMGFQDPPKFAQQFCHWNEASKIKGNMVNMGLL